MCSSRAISATVVFWKSDLPEQAFRDLNNQLMSVLFLRFSFRPHILTILPSISVTMVLARSLRFPQMGSKASILFFNFT